MQPIQNAAPRPPGEKPPPSRQPAESQLSPVQRTVLERLITRIVALNQQQSAEVWAGLKHDLELKSDEPLLSRHFPAAEQHLNQRLTQAQNTLATRQVIQQLTELLPLGNNRQAVSNFIRQQYGQTALSQLTQTQLKTVLTLLQNHPLAIAGPAQHVSPTQSTPVIDRPLQPAEQIILNQLVSKLAAATGESSKHIWQNVLEKVQLKPGEPVPLRFFAPLSNWLQAHHTLSQHPTPTFETLQVALKQPLTEQELEWITDYSQQRFHATPQTVLSPFQVQDILTQILLTRTERQPGSLEVREIKPIASPFFVSALESIKNVSTRSSAAIITLLVVILVLWIVI